MAQFDLVRALWCGIHDRGGIAWLVLGDEGAQTLARRLHRDAGLQYRFAELLGVPPEHFRTTAVEAIRAFSGFSGGFTSPQEIANYLETGQRR